MTSTALQPNLLITGADEVARWLDDRGLPELRALRYRRVKPGASEIAGLELADGPAFLVRWTRPDPGKIGKYLRRTPDAVLHREEDVLLARLPADRHLPGVTRHAGLLDGATTLSYKPMRRWVGRRESDTGPVVLRLYGAGTATAALTRHRIVAQAVPGVALVRRVLTDDTLELDHLPGSGAAPDWFAAGELLRRWHGVRLPATALAARRPDWTASANLAALLVPERASRLRAAVAAVEVPTAPGTALCHGDLSPDQVLQGPSGPALLDLDHAGREDPSWDLASWWVTAPEPGRSALLAGYGLEIAALGPDLSSQGPNLPGGGLEFAGHGPDAGAGRVGADLAALPDPVLQVLPAVCLGRSTEAFRNCRPDWRSELDRLLDLAERSLRLRAGRR